MEIVEYIIKKLEILGIDTVFGLPGDYNFNILDRILKSEKLTWVNCTNELNAAYATDGYTRIKGYGALITTYGVGELSAINAIAGAYAENLPVVHIVGAPYSAHIKNNTLIHHNFAKPDYFVFEKIYKNVTASTAFLTPENAKNEIDKAFNILVNEKLPVYLVIPMDVCCKCLENKDFETFNIKKSNPRNLNLAFEKITSLINNAESPVVLVDYLIKRFQLQKPVSKFLTKTNINFSTMLMGKGAISEDLLNFLGTNAGNCSKKRLIDAVKNSDLLITIGFLNADLNTMGFTALFDKIPKIQIEKKYVKIKEEIFEDVLIQDIINLLADIPAKSRAISQKTETLACKIEQEGPIKTEDILEKIENVFDKNDIFLIDTGILSLTGAFLNLKPDMEYLSQTLWGSIGWATPASFGAQMADKKRNVILFTGEGSHQLTVQEVSNFFAHDLHPVIFVLNNGGYTIERLLSKDKTDSFNDIINWDYQKLISAFSNGREFYKSQAKTLKELKEVLENVKKIKGQKLCYIEIFADKLDFTECSKKLVSNLKSFKNKIESQG